MYEYHSSLDSYERWKANVKVQWSGVTGELVILDTAITSNYHHGKQIASPLIIFIEISDSFVSHLYRSFHQRLLLYK
jgi:hypothetical protein